MAKFTIIIPTYNERENIKTLLVNISEVLKNQKEWKILVVDDNSPDGTGDVVKKHDVKKNKSYKRQVFLLAREKKEGLGNAYIAGMKEAFEKMGADFVITMDADHSHKPRYIPSLVAQIHMGCDFVVGSRYIAEGTIPKEWPLHRKIFSIGGNLIVPIFVGSKKLTDWTSGFRAIRKSVYQKVRPLILRDHAQNKGYTFNISFAYHTVDLNFKVGEVPIKFPDRKYGESKLGFEYLVHTPIFLITTRLRKFLSV